MIFESVQHFLRWQQSDHEESYRGKRDLYATSGGFDPLHVGHLRCILETVALSNNVYKYPIVYKPIVAVLVNCDDFLKAKKGYVFMNLEDRMEIIDAIKGVDAVIPWYYQNEDFTVKSALEALKPSHFTKGGDRTDASSIPEWELCMSIGCEVITGVGGTKIRSSSELVENADRFNLEAVELMGWTEGYMDAADK